MVSRNWSWTYFPTETDLDFSPPDSVTEDNALKYGIYQLEICPDSGQLHVQGYFEFVRPVRFTHLRRICNSSSLHHEPSRGSPQQNRLYCSKLAGQAAHPTEFGEISQGPGTRTDLQAIFRAMDEGATPEEVARAYTVTWARYPRAVDRYYLVVGPKREWPMEVHVYYGLTGSGKSRAVHDSARARGLDVYDVMSPNCSNGAVWFDGYMREPIVLLDDFYGWLPWTFLLKLLDRYPLRVQTKGGSVPFLSKEIYITSNCHPNQWYNYGPRMHYTALERRINTITEYPITPE